MNPDPPSLAPLSLDPPAAAIPGESLAGLRVEIDRLDEEMHALLMARGDIIDRLIAVKARQGGGSAFRPAREAAMMRKIAERHRGLLPLDAAEGIWRIIISTFTFAQAPYAVHVDASGGDAAMRDSARFHFGFTPPYIAHKGAPETIAAVAQSSGDLGLIRLDGDATAGAWWTALSGIEAPKIIARLPFVERPDHPAGTPVFVISLPLAEAAARDQTLYAVSIERWREELVAALAAHGAEILGNASHGLGLSLMIAAQGSPGAEGLGSWLSGVDVGDLRIAEIGSHAARYDFAADSLEREMAKALQSDTKDFK